MKKQWIYTLCLIFVIQGFTKSIKAQENPVEKTNYVGAQKNGLPDGKGILTDSAGNQFTGNFKKGKKEGYGELKFKTEVGRDSILTGYWKKDQYIGLYEAPFKVISKSYMISNATITHEPANSQNNTIELSVESVSGGTATLSGEMPKPRLTEHNFNKGSFQTFFERTNQQKRNVYLFQHVLFPVIAVFKFGSEDIMVELNEAKNYKIQVVLRD